MIVGFDFTSRANLALHQALALSGNFGQTELHVITVLDRHMKKAGLIDEVDFANAQRMQARSTEIVKRTARDHDLTPAHVHVHARIGTPEKEILGLAEEISADLILLGTHGHTGIERLLLGSVAEEIMHRARCPVLVTRPKTYEEHPAAGAPRPELPDPYKGPTEYLEPHIWHFESDAMTRPNEWPIS
jgi:nucleotide-binding universal stress UspA family protein